MQKNSPKYFPELKRVRQKTDAYCGPAVIEMLSSFIGTYVNQNKLVKLTGVGKKIDKHGMTIKDLAKAVKIMVPEGEFWFKESAKLSDLDKLVNEYRHPVGVEWQGVFEEYTEKDFPDNGHYGVLTFINKSKNLVYIADPFRRFAKEDRKFKLDFFERRWWDDNDVRNPKTGKMEAVRDDHVIFIITKKNETFPRELKMARG